MATTAAEAVKDAPSSGGAHKGDYKSPSYRRIFTKSRAMEFFDPDELVKQTEQPGKRLPIVVLKELIDNSLDACENADILPTIKAQWWGDDAGLSRMSVWDNGPGFPFQVLEKIIDFFVFVSDKEAYVAPTRGRQGNALKTVLTIPYVLATTHGLNEDMSFVRIESNGKGREVSISLDRVREQPLLDVVDVETSVRKGTNVTVWPLYSPLQDAEIRADYYHFLEGYALFNPHAEFTVLADNGTISHPRLTEKIEKWRPRNPTSPHWYDEGALGKLIGYHIAQADTPLREFLGQFVGLKSTQKRAEICDGLPGKKHLSDFEVGGKLDAEAIRTLLEAMQAASRKVKANALGVLGRVPLLRFCPENQREEAIYAKLTNDDIPRVVEVAGWARKDSDGLRIYCGLNHSPTYADPLSPTHLRGSHLREDFQGHGIEGFVRDLFGPRAESGTVVVHIVEPTVKFRGKGKTTIVAMVGIADDVTKALLKAFGKQAAKRRKAERYHSRGHGSSMFRWRSNDTTVKAVVFKHLPEAIRKVSSNGTYRYTARQLYYALRPLVEPALQENTAHPTKLEYDTFKIYIDEWAESEGGDILRGIIFDPRGHFIEPHSTPPIEVEWAPYTGQAPIEVGTLEAERYGVPDHLYNKVLFVEKEGFNIIFDDAELKEKYDMAILSSKGFSTRAIKTLLKKVEGKATILVLHDCDIYGYSIADKLQQATRSSKVSVEVVDIGLNLADARAMGLQEEEVHYRKKPCDNATIKRLSNEERVFFGGREGFGAWGRSTEGKRIELNAMTPEQLLEYVERKLDEHGLTEKVVPPDEVIEKEYVKEVSRQVDDSLLDLVANALEQRFGVDIRKLAEEFKGELVKENGMSSEVEGLVEKSPEKLWFHLVKEKAEKTVAEKEDTFVDRLRRGME